VHRVENHPALPWELVPEFMTELRSMPGIAPRCLEFTILTAARSGEPRGATWDEIAGNLWTVLAHRMKGKREHRVPLVPAAIAVLDRMREVQMNDYIFPGDVAADVPLSDMALTETIRRMNEARQGLQSAVGGSQAGRRHVVPHGFRSSFRDWGEGTAFAGWLAEAALAHTKGDKVEAAYRRGDALAKRRELMEAWAAYCG
jgi:integrase